MMKSMRKGEELVFLQLLSIMKLLTLRMMPILFLSEVNGNS